MIVKKLLLIFFTFFSLSSSQGKIKSLEDSQGRYSLAFELELGMNEITKIAHYFDFSKLESERSIVLTEGVLNHHQLNENFYDTLPAYIKDKLNFGLVAKGKKSLFQVHHKKIQRRWKSLSFEEKEKVIPTLEFLSNEAKSFIIVNLRNREIVGPKDPKGTQGFIPLKENAPQILKELSYHIDGSGGGMPDPLEFNFYTPTLDPQIFWKRLKELARLVGINNITFSKDPHPNLSLHIHYGHGEKKSLVQTFSWYKKLLLLRLFEKGYSPKRILDLKEDRIDKNSNTAGMYYGVNSYNKSILRTGHPGYYEFSESEKESFLQPYRVEVRAHALPLQEEMNEVVALMIMPEEKAIKRIKEEIISLHERKPHLVNHILRIAPFFLVDFYFLFGQDPIPKPLKEKIELRLKRNSSKALLFIDDVLSRLELLNLINDEIFHYLLTLQRRYPLKKLYGIIDLYFDLHKNPGLLKKFVFFLFDLSKESSQKTKGDIASVLALYASHEDPVIRRRIILFLRSNLEANEVSDESKLIVLNRLKHPHLSLKDKFIRKILNKLLKKFKEPSSSPERTQALHTFTNNLVLFRKYKNQYLPIVAKLFFHKQLNNKDVFYLWIILNNPHSSVFDRRYASNLLQRLTPEKKELLLQMANKYILNQQHNVRLFFLAILSPKFTTTPPSYYTDYMELAAKRLASKNYEYFLKDLQDFHKFNGAKEILNIATFKDASFFHFLRRRFNSRKITSEERKNIMKLVPYLNPSDPFAVETMLAIAEKSQDTELQKNILDILIEKKPIEINLASQKKIGYYLDHNNSQVAQRAQEIQEHINDIHKKLKGATTIYLTSILCKRVFNKVFTLNGQ